MLIEIIGPLFATAPHLVEAGCQGNRGCQGDGYFEDTPQHLISLMGKPGKN
jgi:hypothetical protein